MPDQIQGLRDMVAERKAKDGDDLQVTPFLREYVHDICEDNELGIPRSEHDFEILELCIQNVTECQEFEKLLIKEIDRMNFLKD